MREDILFTVQNILMLFLRGEVLKSTFGFAFLDKTLPIFCNSKKKSSLFIALADLKLSFCKPGFGIGLAWFGSDSFEMIVV